MDSRLALVLLVAAGCAKAAAPVPTPKPNVDPGRIPPPPVETPPPAKEPVLPPSEAFRRGLMPLASTNAWAFRQAHPLADGRGVLIAILDSGIDPSVPGLATTSAGAAKVLDLRDFSGEGRIALTPVAVKGDTIPVAGRPLAGFRRVMSLAAGSAVYTGTIAERPLGEMPASDLNDDGDNADTLAVVVAKASDGWVLFADANGNGTLADDKPVHDYLAGRETFGWTTGGRPAPVGVAVNFGGGSVPETNLFFDTSGHGTHVAGIAAGAGLYGIRGFDGVAPGAFLVGLKISNNAYGGISVTGSMLAAMDYAIKFAKTRGLPLVMNMSFGVGNEREGAARIDAIVDSVLAANPEVVFATSAGNDGPGLSTVGFPGSADRVISVGATYPPAFTGANATGEVVAFFSSRGGELAKPDLLAPGIAYSSVPRWDTGEEDKSGTSMASPHAAGAIALVLSGLAQEKRGWTAAQVKQAFVASARPMALSLRADQGAGLIDVIAADQVLRRLPAAAVVRTRVGGLPAGAIFRVAAGRSSDTTVAVEIDGGLPGPVRLVSNAGWLAAPATVQLTPPKTTFAVTVKSTASAGPGVAGATLTGWATDTTIGPLFRIPATVVTPVPAADSTTVVRGTLPPAGVLRAFLAADTARPFRVRVGVAQKGLQILAFLGEPGGEPYRNDSGIPGGSGEEAALYDVDGRDVVGGWYEAIAVAPPNAGGTVEVRIDRSPVVLRAARGPKDTVIATLVGAAAAPVRGTTMFGLIGAERGVAVSQSGSAERRIPFQIPAWAHRIVVDFDLPRTIWPLFTDFGLTLLDAEGQLVAKSPLNYAFGRLSATLDSAQVGRAATVVLAPGLADRAGRPAWDGNLTIKLYAESPVLVDPAGPADFELAAGRSGTVRFPLGKIPWTLPDGFFPLGNLVVDVGGELWSRESRLPEPLPPVMR